MQIFVSLSCLLLSVSWPWATAVEPPFPQSIVEILNERSVLPSLVDTTLLLASIPPATLDAFLATTQNTNNTLPSPIATTFFNLTTGVVNETLTVLPLDYVTARRIIPSQYDILTRSIHAVLPGFPTDKYPLVLSTQIHHGISTYGFTTPNFTSAQFRFPFIDLLGDRYSTFSYIPTIYISNDPFAVAGTLAYHEEAIVATFNPSLDPNAAVPGSRDGEVYFHVLINGNPVLNASFRPQWGIYGEVGDYPRDFYTNVTNQSTFGCPNSSCLLTCDNQIRFFHTNLTTGKYAPQGISASISIAPSPKSGLSFFRNGAEFVGAKSVKVTQAFLELNYLDGKDLKGLSYLGV